VGLSIYHAILEKNGGSLEFGSELDLGTTIIIDLLIRE
jgi:hypothetical protein